MLTPSWEADMSSTGQEIHNILWNPKVYYCIHMSLPVDLPLTIYINAHPVSKSHKVL